MAGKKEFKEGELVWSRRRNWRFWPSKIMKLPAGVKQRKNQRYVCFFGTEQCSFVKVENIHKHSYNLLRLYVDLTKSTDFNAALKQMCEASRRLRSPMSEDEYERFKNILLFYPSLLPDLPEPDSEPVEMIVPTDKIIGIIGLETYGKTLVRNGIYSGHKIMVWDQNPEICADLVEMGVTTAETPSDLVEKTDIVISCVFHLNAMKNLVYGKNGIISGLKKCAPRSKGFVQMQKEDLDKSRALIIHIAICMKRMKYLDACISIEKTRRGECLDIVCQGNLELFKNCKSCLLGLTSKVCFLSDNPKYCCDDCKKGKNVL